MKSSALTNTICHTDLGFPGFHRCWCVAPNPHLQQHTTVASSHACFTQHGVGSNIEAVTSVRLHFIQAAVGSLGNTAVGSKAHILAIPNAILACAHSQLIIQHLQLSK